MEAKTELSLQYEIKIDFIELDTMLDNRRYAVGINTWKDHIGNLHVNAAINCMYNGEFGDSDLQVCYDKIAEELKHPTPIKCKIERITEQGKVKVYNGKVLLRGLHRNKCFVFIDLIGVKPND